MSFHVPEGYRLREGPLASDESYGNNGAFVLPGLHGWKPLAIIASNGLGWEHVSVHALDASGRECTPTWSEMCRAKDAFWDSEDIVMQLHPRRSEYINEHPHVLHLWRPVGQEIPQPPVACV
jgi:hypothetical protein